MSSVDLFASDGLASSTSEDVVMRGGQRAPQAFYDAVRDQVEEFIESASFGKSYTVKQMCGPGFWAELEGEERNLAGYCVADMVHRGLLPLAFEGRTSANARLYTPK